MFAEACSTRRSSTQMNGNTIYLALTDHIQSGPWFSTGKYRKPSTLFITGVGEILSALRKTEKVTLWPCSKIMTEAQYLQSKK